MRIAAGDTSPSLRGAPGGLPVKVLTSQLVFLHRQRCTPPLVLPFAFTSVLPHPGQGGRSPLSLLGALCGFPVFIHVTNMLLAID